MTATIRSNRHGTEFSIVLGAASKYAEEAGYECSVKLSSEHWDGDHTYPLGFQVDGIWMGRCDLLALRTRLSDWVGLPLPQLAATELTGEFRLAKLPGQCVNLNFGSREDTISSHKPVISVKIKAGVLNAEFHFVTDQSCIGLFVDELSQV